MIIEMVDFGLKRTDENLFKNSYQMMNLKQLSYVEDSLKYDIHHSESSLETTLEKSSYYKNKNFLKKIDFNRPPPDTAANADTVKKEARGKTIFLNGDSIFHNMSKPEKERILAQSLNYARGAMNFINNNFANSDNMIRRLRKYQIETQRKFTLSFACLVFFFIGAPLGAIIRKGGLGMPVVVSVLFFLVYYIISITGEKFVRESVISPFTGMWLSTFILIPLSAFLTYKASTDSVIMNIDTYFNFFKRVFRKRKT